MSRSNPTILFQNLSEFSTPPNMGGTSQTPIPYNLPPLAREQIMQSLNAQLQFIQQQISLFSQGLNDTLAIGTSTPISVPAIGANNDNRLPLQAEREEPRDNRNRRQESNSEQESESDFPRRADFNRQLWEALHKARTEPDEIKECILDGSTPFVHIIMATLIPSKFKVPPLDQYDGTGDPVAYVSIFRMKMILQNVNDAIMYLVFPTTLMNTAQR